LEISKHPDIKLELFFANQWLTPEKKLPENCPLRELPYQTFPMAENFTERLWKLTGYPAMDACIPNGTDWLFAPMETHIPVRKCPVAITIYDLQAFESDLPWSQSWQHRWFRYKWGRWVRRAIDHSRIVFTISEFSKQRMVSLLGANPAKIINIGCGVEKPFFEVAQDSPYQPTLPTEQPYVFMIGGLRQKKGGDAYLALANALQQIKSEVQIVIAGQSDPQYMEKARQFPNIQLLGIVPDSELPNLLRGSLALVFLSLYEGFGIPPLEAMAAGVPAVGANCASLPEVVGDAGFVVDPFNTGEVVEILTSLCNDTRLRQTYIDKGRQHVKQYTWSSCADKVLEAFNKFG
jgi:glycosyltransferase involved in cell wall biosynthesis